MISPPAPEHFTSRLRSPTVAARVGVWLGVAFTLCFVTGLISHYAQLPSHPIPWPTSPSWGYRLTQGLHVSSGLAAIPLLLVKLWAVYPRLFERLPLRAPGRLALAGLERGSIGVLVAASVFQLATGVLNAAQWYPWREFSFRTTHYALAWVSIGALALHIAVKLPVIRDVLARPIDDTTHDRPTAVTPGPLTRRGLVRVTFVAAGVLTVLTAGSTVPALRRISLFGVRSGRGPAGIPINKSARAAVVTASATSADYRLSLVVDGTPVRELTLAELRALPQVTHTLPIACVEGWSASGEWHGVTVRVLLALAGVPAWTDVIVTSLQEHGAFRRTSLPGNVAADPRTLLALGLNGEPLALDHGYPARLIAPNRPGVLQTKWVSSLEVTT